MYFHLGFPLLVVPFLSVVNDTNFAISLTVVILGTVFGLIVLAVNAFAYDYDKTGACVGYLLLGAALLSAVFGIIPIVMVVVAAGFVYYFFWRMIIKNFLVMLGKG